MTLMEAAKKWDLSVNWIRELVKSGRVQATLRKDVPVPYYEIPDDAQKPGSMSRAPHRKGTKAVITKEALRRRETRAAEKRVAKANKPPKKATSTLLVEDDVSEVKADS